MVAISIMIEGQMGLNWPRWQRLVAEVDRLGFAGLFRSDHFVSPRPPDADALETLVSLAYLAGNTQHVHFGPLVAPVSFRDPVMLARQAAALDDLSGGRMILGLGAGWSEREHTMFGYDLGDIPTRMARLEEGLEVATRLLRSEPPVSFDGRFYHLRDAVLLPRPAHPGGPRLLIGGNGPQRTLPLAARYADIWNGTSRTPDEFRELSARLDDLTQQAGRAPGDIRRTLMTVAVFGRDQATLEQVPDRLRRFTNRVQEPGETPTSALEKWRQEGREIVGTPPEVIERIAAYGAAGVEELMLQWLDMDDLDGLQAFAAEVLPHV